ncbi:MAG TPA: hypothetical protein QGF58_26665 [Myxococcota bacterium]|nr:hypothetical protein [Myxococcota bacterium]
MSTLMALAPLVLPYHRVTPVPDAAAEVLLAADPGPHDCIVSVLVDPYGSILDAEPIDCPVELRSSAAEAAWRWGFHPPIVEDRATTGRMDLHFVYASQVGVVETISPEVDVFVAPVAMPGWPREPQLRGMLRDELLATDRSGVRCTLELEVDSRSRPAAIEVIDCPAEAALVVTRSLKRYGLDVVGAEPGDGTRYGMEIWLTP